MVSSAERCDQCLVKVCSVVMRSWLGMKKGVVMAKDEHDHG